MEVFKDFKVVGVDRDHVEKDITMANASSILSCFPASRTIFG